MEAEEVAIRFVPADDVPDAEQSIGEKIKTGIKTMLAGDESVAEAPKATTKRGRKTTAKQPGICEKNAPFMAKMVSVTMAVFMPELAEPYEVNGQILTVVPGPDELIPVIQPLTKIADRHLKIGAVSEDVADLSEAVTALLQVSVMTYMNLTTLRRLKELDAEKENKQQNTKREAMNATGLDPAPAFTF